MDYIARSIPVIPSVRLKERGERCYICVYPRLACYFPRYKDRKPRTRRLTTGHGHNLNIVRGAVPSGLLRRKEKVVYPVKKRLPDRKKLVFRQKKPSRRKFWLSVQFSGAEGIGGVSLSSRCSGMSIKVTVIQNGHRGPPSTSFLHCKRGSGCSLPSSVGARVNLVFLLTPPFLRRWRGDP